MINEDAIFGEMKYDYGWTKKETINLFDEQYEIECIASAYKSQEITQSQREAYLEYRKNRNHIIENIEKTLKSYCKKIQFEGLLESIQPTELIFKRDGSLGLLCNCEWDADNGLVICIKPTYKVELQDLFL